MQGGDILGKIIRSSMDIVVEHYNSILARCNATTDAAERTVLVRKLKNLSGVIMFLISVQKLNS
jgi:glutathionyl-hydroquinone reductase